MKWFKHFSLNSIQDPTATRLIDDYGVVAYGRYYLMIECLVRSAEEFDSAPTVEFTAKHWAEVLHLKSKKVESFLEQMQLLGIIKLVCSENGFAVELLNYEKLLSKAAVSSEKRSTSGRPREDKNTYSKLELKRTGSIKAQHGDLAHNPILAFAAQSSPEANQAFQDLLKREKVAS